MKRLILGSALALCASGALAQDTVRIATEGNYPAYNYLDDAGNLAGFEVELGTAICERASLTCEFVQNEWDSIIPNLVSGNYDVIMAGMSITHEQDVVVDFTQDYSPATPSAFVALGADADFETGTVAVRASTIKAEHIAQSGATLLEFATPEETVAAVRNGEADAVFADSDHLLAIVEESGGELTFVGERVPLRGGVGAAIRESDTELRDTLDAAIRSMKDDGSLNELLIERFGDEAQTY